MNDQPKVYRIRRRSDGFWYGKSARYYNADHESCWHPKAGKFMTEKALNAVLRGHRKQWLEMVDVVEYNTIEVYSVKGTSWCQANLP